MPVLVMVALTLAVGAAALSLPLDAASAPTLRATSSAWNLIAPHAAGG